MRRTEHAKKSHKSAFLTKKDCDSKKLFIKLSLYF